MLNTNNLKLKRIWFANKSQIRMGQKYTQLSPREVDAYSKKRIIQTTTTLDEELPPLYYQVYITL